MGSTREIPSWARCPKTSRHLFLEIIRQDSRERICIDEKPGYLLGRSEKVLNESLNQIGFQENPCRESYGTEVGVCARRTATLFAVTRLAAESMPVWRTMKRAGCTLLISILSMVLPFPMIS